MILMDKKGCCDDCGKGQPDFSAPLMHVKAPQRAVAVRQLQGLQDLQPGEPSNASGLQLGSMVFASAVSACIFYGVSRLLDFTFYGHTGPTTGNRK